MGSYFDDGMTNECTDFGYGMFAIYQCTGGGSGIKVTLHTTIDCDDDVEPFMEMTTGTFDCITEEGSLLPGCGYDSSGNSAWQPESQPSSTEIKVTCATGGLGAIVGATGLSVWIILLILVLVGLFVAGIVYLVYKKMCG